MANTVTRVKLLDGPSHLTVQVFMASDGASGELTNLCLLDPTDDVFPTMPARQSFIIKQIWYEMYGFTLTFSFNSLNPFPVWTLTPGASLRHDWRFFGGLRDYSSMPLYPDSDTPGLMTGIRQQNLAPGGYPTMPEGAPGGLSSDGKLLISTNGFTDIGDTASFVLWIEKRDRPNPQMD